MRHTVPADDLRRVVEPNRADERARRKERATRAEHHGDEIDDDLVDEAQPQCLAADLTSCHIDDPVTRVVLSGADGRLDVVDERERRAVFLPSGQCLNARMYLAVRGFLSLMRVTSVRRNRGDPDDRPCWP